MADPVTIATTAYDLYNEWQQKKKDKKKADDTIRKIINAGAFSYFIL